MFVKPAPGLKVRDPVSKLHIPETGMEVPEESYWFRRLRSGDVVPASPPLAVAPASVVSPKQIPDSKGGK
jgi:hypothetical protein